MKDFSSLRWGRMEPFKLGLIQEMEKSIYQIDFEVEENDTVLDIGASIGIFTLSILDKNPKQVICVEPDINFFKCLVQNTSGQKVVCLNNMIGCQNNFLVNNVGAPLNSLPPTLDFQQLLYKYNIHNLDFLKIDCEGCEYELFNLENIFGILNNTKKIVGEFHLSSPELKQKFTKFIHEILPLVPKYRIYTVGGTPITGKEYSQEFLDFYTEVIIYIDNR